MLSAHHITDALSVMLLFFGIAGILVPLLQRVRISPVLAYLICGVVVGPYGLASLQQEFPFLSFITISRMDTVQVLGEFGIMTLMFMIGLELSLDRLKDLRRLILGLGSSQILVTGAVIGAIAWAFGNRIESAILIGASLALSSTAIVMKLLEDQHLANRPVGTVCFSVLLMQDLAVVPMLVLASAFAGAGQGEGGVLLALVSALVLGALTVTALYVGGRWLLDRLLQSVSASHNPEWLAAFTVFIVVGCAFITQSAGMSLALGAFVAGLLIAETELKHEVEVIVSPLKGLLLGIFFLSVGMMINLEEISRTPFLLALSVAGILMLKALICFALCLAFRVPVRQAVEASVYLSQPGEFALLILGVALAANLMPVQDVQFFLLVTALAMMVSPLVFRLAGPLRRKVCGFIGEKAEEGNIPLLSERVVVIAGFGHVGQLLGRALEEQRIPYIAFDKDISRVRALRREGLRVIYGDARRIELWQRLHSGTLVGAVIAVNDPSATHVILQSVRAQWPLLPVIVRARDREESVQLYDLGATHVVTETLESSLSIARLLMQQLGTDEEELAPIIHKLRESAAHGLA